MGPAATILLMQKVMRAVPARDDADHVPLIVHQTPQVPSRINALVEGRGPDPMPVLISMAQDLERAGAQGLAMPCYTAHHYAFAMTHATSLPFLDMLELTAAELSARGASRVGMLAPPATRMTEVFAAYFQRHGLGAVWLEDDAALLDIIRDVRAGAPATTLAPRLAEAAGTLARSGADHLLVACTELSPLADALPEDLPRTDGLDCLTAAIARFAGADQDTG